MVTLIQADRKSAVLKPSSLACLTHIPTINLTAGCAHGCLYCYARGYTIYPGDGKVVLYRNTLEKLEEELARKRVRPQAVYFSPSTDLFQPVPEVLQLGHGILEFLLSSGIGVAFLSKGLIPDVTLRLLLSHPDKVRAQIGIITVDEAVQRAIEPNAATPTRRLEQMARLAEEGIATEARIIPILPGITDGPDALERLLSAVADTGVRNAAISTLFLRPAITNSIKRGVSDEMMLKRLLGFYGAASRVTVRAEHSSVMPLPLERRREIYGRARQLAEKYRMELSICTCMNPDLSGGTCNITGAWPERLERNMQASLFQKGD